MPKNPKKQKRKNDVAAPAKAAKPAQQWICGNIMSNDSQCGAIKSSRSELVRHKNGCGGRGSGQQERASGCRTVVEIRAPDKQLAAAVR